MSDLKVNVRAEEADARIEIAAEQPDARIEIRVAGEGKDGYTPRRGVDYWTEADVQDIHDYVDVQLENVETGSQGPQGEKGDTGPQGEKGDTGPAGPQGEKGDTGPAGPQGEKGDTGPAGPQGEKGDTGPAGPQGEKGDTGADGKTPVKGTDYYTTADKNEMVNLVKAALPAVTLTGTDKNDVVHTWTLYGVEA